MHRIVLGLAIAALGLCLGAAGEHTPCTIGIEMPVQLPVTPAVEAALAEMGVGYINYYVKPWAGSPDALAEEANAAMIALCERLGVDFSLSCFTVNPPAPCVKAAQASKAAFRGIVFDELAHCRLLNPHEAAEDLADRTAFTSLDDAYAQTIEGYRKLYDHYAEQGVDVVATHVFPVLHHVAARAGFHPCAKTQKEFYSPVSLAIALGAALQYGRELWVDCDLWHYDLVPGHPPEELHSNLLLAYWLGADVIYIEGCGHNLTPVGEQGIPFSVMTQVTPSKHQLTAHGEVIRRFIREYVPAHPRPWRFTDITPTIAILRFPDSDYGQRFQHVANPDTPGPMDSWHAGLYGAPQLPSSADTEAWFRLWNLLTHGATGHDGLSYFKPYLAAAGYERPVEENRVQSLYSRPVQAAAHPFFVPMNNVVVFDHLATYQHLEDIPLLFLVGTQISKDTMAAVRKRVEEGATAVIWHGLAEGLGFTYEGGVQAIPEGKGRFVITDTYSANALYQQIWPHMGRPDEIRYRFGTHTVRLKKVDANRVTVHIDES